MRKPRAKKTPMIKPRRTNSDGILVDVFDAKRVSGEYHIELVCGHSVQRPVERMVMTCGVTGERFIRERPAPKRCRCLVCVTVAAEV